MHAILALAASHLEAKTGVVLTSSAMYHRVLAIKGSNEAMSKTRRTGSDGDALLASSYLLTFQSTFMEDGMSEFFLFIRGCTLITNQLKAENIPMAFFLSEDNHFQTMEKVLSHALPVIDPLLIEGAAKSLAALEPFLEQSALKLYKLLIHWTEEIKKASVNGAFPYLAHL